MRRYDTWRDFFYHSGDIFLPLSLRRLLDIDILGSSNMKDGYYYYISGWSFLHLISGMLIGYVMLYKWDWLEKMEKKVWRRGWVEGRYGEKDGEKDKKDKIKKYILYLLVLHTLWEIWQLMIGMSTLKRYRGSGGIIDILMDTVMFLVGGIMILLLIR